MKLLDEDHFPHLLVICGTLIVLGGFIADTIQNRGDQPEIKKEEITRIKAEVEK